MNRNLREGQIFTFDWDWSQIMWKNKGIEYDSFMKLSVKLMINGFNELVFYWWAYLCINF
jgi:hypothetical protein